LERIPTIKIFEVGQFDALPHAKHVSCTAETIEQHPHIASIQSGDLIGCFCAGMSKALQRVLNVCPGSNDGAEYHEAEREESHSSDGATKPEHFPVCDQDNGQVLKDCVDRD